MGEATIAALFFADDMVITAETEAELKLKLEILGNFMKERHLEINFSKTEIIKIGRGSSEEKTWTILKEDGTEEGTISETNLYKYLGIKLGRSRTFLQHRNHMERQLPRLKALLKVKSRNTPSRTRAASAQWKQAVLPKILYGAEIITYTKTWINEVEKAQNNVGRWILGVRPSTTTVGVRAELGWISVEGEIELRKANYWKRLHTLPSSRWAHQALQEVLKGNYESDWLKGTRLALSTTGMDQTAGQAISRKGQVKRCIVEKAQQTWNQTKRTSASLRPHPKQSYMGVEDFVWEDSKRRTTLCKLRLGDVGKKWLAEQECQACQKKGIQDMRQHILLDCQELEQERREGYLGKTIETCRQLGMNATQTVRELLASTSKTGMDSLHRLYEKWNKPS